MSTSPNITKDALPPLSATEPKDKASAPANTPEPQMSKGEKWYNWIVYKGINYWVNLIGSLWIADMLISGKGQKPLAYAIGKSASLLNKMGVPLKTAYHNSKTALETLSLMSGGWALLIPMKALEDHKRWVVHKLNDLMGVDQTAPDGHKQTPDEIYIECEQPKQSWFNVFKRRVFATLAVVGTGQVIEHAFAARNIIKPGQTYSLNPYDPAAKSVTFDAHHLGGKERATDVIMGWVNKGSEMIGANAVIKKPWVQRWLGLAALDTGFTKITAIVMEMTNGASKRKAPHEIGDETSKPAEFEIGDGLKPHELKSIPLPQPRHQDHEKLRHKYKDEGFSAAISRQSETTAHTQLTV